MAKFDVFVGRKNELALIDEWVDKWGTTHLIAVDGDGGVGKTWLLLEVLRRYGYDERFALVYLDAAEHPYSSWYDVRFLVRQLGEEHLHTALAKKDIASLLLDRGGPAARETASVLLTQALSTLDRLLPADDGNVAEAESLLCDLAPEDLEQQMERLRQFAQSNRLRVAAADITGAIPLMVVSDFLTEIAEVVLARAVVSLALSWWMVRAINSLPVPLSPRISTVASESATCSIILLIPRVARLLPERLRNSSSGRRGASPYRCDSANTCDLCSNDEIASYWHGRRSVPSTSPLTNISSPAFSWICISAGRGSQPLIALR